MSLLKRKRNRLPVLLAASALLWRLAFVDVQAQSGFQSGSTGADGAFSPTASQAIQIPESGVFNFTTVNIPAGVIITFLPNAKNTPVIILTGGDVVINGTLDVSGQAGSTNGAGGAAGPGGFRGGDGANGLNQTKGNAGDGPGAGAGGGSASSAGPSSQVPRTNGVVPIGGGSPGGSGGGGFQLRGGDGDIGTGGQFYATAAMINPVGGSGGGGGGAVSGSGHSGGGGGGGAGAIVIASSGSIRFGDGSGNAGTIKAQGGRGSNGDLSGGPGAGPGNGGGGSGGAIRLVANTISGAATLNVSGGTVGAPGPQSRRDTPAGARANPLSVISPGGPSGQGASGYVRVESPDQSGLSAQTQVQVSQALPSSAIPVNPPQLRIASVGGVATPSAPVGSFHASPDLMVPASQANPISVVVEATNVPVGTVVQVTVIPATGTRSTVDSDPLAGTAASATATANVNLPTETSALVATAVINLLSSRAAPVFINGERIARIIVTAASGGQSEVSYITESGKRINAH